MTAPIRWGAILLLAGAACGSIASNTDETVITVGERAFGEADLDRFVDSRIGLGATLDAPLLSALLDEFAREQLLLIGAEEAGVEVSEIQLLTEIGALNRGPGTDAVQPEDDRQRPDPARSFAPREEEAAHFRAQVENRLRVDRLIETVVLAGLEASDEATRLEYESGRAFYARPETVTLSEQRFDVREAAEAAAARSKGSEEAAASRFIEIGSFRRGELPDAVDRVVFGLEPGDTTGVIETAAGLRIFRVDRRLPPGPLEFEEVEEVARLTVLRREADARVEAFVAELRARHPITVHTARLSFPYVGHLPQGE